MIQKNLHEKYSPMYHLGALGIGGAWPSRSFFTSTSCCHMKAASYLSIQLWPVLTDGPSLKALWIGLCLLVVFALSAMHIALMIWNTREFGLFKKTEAYHKLRNSSAEISLMVVPLTMAMTVNVLLDLAADPGIVGSDRICSQWQ